MKPLGEAAVELPWLAPCADALVALTRQAGAAWPAVRFDPGCVLLLARARVGQAFQPAIALGQTRMSAPPDRIDSSESTTAALELAVRLLTPGSSHFVNWSRSGPDLVYQSCLRQAGLAQSLAEQTGVCEPTHAWTAGLLAGLGWLAVCTIEPQRIADDVERVRALHRSRHTPCAVAPERHTECAYYLGWSMEPAALVRRLARRWQLPQWLTGVIGNLGLPPQVACQLNVDPQLLQIVQLAVACVQRRGMGLGIAIGASWDELHSSLQLTEADVEDCWARSQTLLPPVSWQSPWDHPYLLDLLHLALENRRLADRSAWERLQREVDCLHEALHDQRTHEHQRLAEKKLAALAEFAAGAGHEINNPLAVISGQAQYVLKQLH
ncbi:MAG: HDOD domain-containing protein, partial [Gemmataceae bacterium]|nr:HDOD domain-containing protein [Gemmataceae bacterium]